MLRNHDFLLLSAVAGIISRIDNFFESIFYTKNCQEVESFPRFMELIENCRGIKNVVATILCEGRKKEKVFIEYCASDDLHYPIIRIIFKQQAGEVSVDFADFQQIKKTIVDESIMDAKEKLKEVKRKFPGIKLSLRTHEGKSFSQEMLLFCE